ncbi:MAG: YfhO family protein [Ruminococcus sp.]|nr:YfhO family protein [Ruminococcus sp.]
MNINKKKAVCKIAPYILLFLTTTAILFTVYAIKGIFPFGDNTITYADFAQSYVPQFYHYWDVLHGLKDPFFDRYSGMGISMVSTDMLSPFNIFLLFIPREAILDSMSYFLALKVIVAAMTMYLFINRVFGKINMGYKLGFAMLYSMSGYVLQYYSNIKWLDIVAVFPLLMLGFYYLMKKQKILLFSLSLAVIMLENFYVSVQVIIFLLFTGGLYILVMVSKKNKKYAAFSLAIGTAAGIGLSMFKTLPTFLTLMSSSRGEGNASKGYLSIINVAFKEKLSTNDMNKWFMFMGLELAVLLCVVLIARFIKHKRATAFFVGEMLILCIPIFFEGVNKLWHTGSYVGFPMRSAFTISFLFITGACYCINFECNYKKRLPVQTEQATVPKAETLSEADTAAETETLTEAETAEETEVTAETITDAQSLSEAVPGKPKKTAKLKGFVNKLRNNLAVSIILGVVALVGVCCTIPWLLEASKLIRRYGSYFLNTKNFIIPKLYIMSAVVIIAAFVVILFIGKTKVKGVCVVLAILIPLSINAYSFIGVEKYIYPEQSSQFIKDAEDISSALPKSESVLDRVKNSDNSLNTNYPFIIQRGALSNWTHTVSSEVISAMKNMGYSTSYTRLLDTGGTLLTDALLGVKNIITKEKLEQPLYTLVQNMGEYNYYSCKYTLPTGIVANKSISEIDTATDQIAATNNLLYHSLSDDKENIIEVMSASSKLGCFYNVSKSPNGLTYTVKVTGDKMIYFKSPEKGITVTVNGKQIEVPTYRAEDNIVYPAEFNNNVVALGNFKDEIISITFNKSGLGESDISLYTFDVAKLEKLCSDYNANYNYTVATDNTSLNTTVTASGNDKVFFVPVPYDKGWSVSVNGKQVKVSPAVNGGFMAVPLENGVNEIVFSYYPNGMKTGIAVSVITVALAAFVVWMRKETKMTKPPKLLAVIANWALYVIWVGAIIGVYIIPMIYGIFFSR